MDWVKRKLVDQPSEERARAIMYATDRQSLGTVLATAHRHLRPGGSAVGFDFLSDSLPRRPIELGGHP